MHYICMNNMDHVSVCLNVSFFLIGVLICFLSLFLGWGVTPPTIFSKGGSRFQARVKEEDLFHPFFVCFRRLFFAFFSNGADRKSVV